MGYNNYGGPTMEEKLKTIDWVCEYRECDKVFKRFPAYQRSNRKRYCCQQHATKEMHARHKELGINPNGTLHEDECKICHTKILCYKPSMCDRCKSVGQSIRTLKINFSIEEYLIMLEKQDNKCYICRTESCTTGNRFAIDHCHETNKVRGLLCVSCNVKLGWLEHNKERINEYLTS